MLLQLIDSLENIEQWGIYAFLSTILTIGATVYKLTKNKDIASFLKAIFSFIKSPRKRKLREDEIIRFIRGCIDIDNVIGLYKARLSNKRVSRVLLLLVVQNEDNDACSSFRVVSEYANAIPIIKLFNYQMKSSCDTDNWRKLLKQKIIILGREEISIEVVRDMMALHKEKECIYTRIGYIGENYVVIVMTLLRDGRLEKDIAQSRSMLLQMRSIFRNLKGFSWLS